MASVLTPWEQQPNETDDEYRAFSKWILSGANAAKRFPPDDLQLAYSMRWLERAAARDRLSFNPKQSAKLVPNAMESLAAVLAIEASKLLAASQATTQTTLTAGELTKLGQMFTAIMTAQQAAAAKAEAASGPTEFQTLSEGAQEALLEHLPELTRKGLLK